MKEYPPVTNHTIEHFQQNHPELIVQDARDYLGLTEDQQAVLRKILLARGVNKWFKVRRDLIAYKILLRGKIAEIHQARETARVGRDLKTFHFMKSGQKAFEEVSEALRAMCHSARMVIWPRNTSRTALRSMNTIKVGRKM